MKKLVVFLVALTIIGPLAGLMGVATLMSTASRACGSAPLVIGSIPESLTAHTRDGSIVTLNKQQLTHAATITTTAARIPGVAREGALIALMAALTESTLRMLANTSAYPESANYPNDGVGSDHDSLGLFQMRAASGWGTVAELMDPEYQARAFFGGPAGPNTGSPRGLLDIVGWELLDPGQAAQAVEVSAYPDRYQNYQPVADSILTTLSQVQSASRAGSGLALPETSRVAFPLPAGTSTNTDSFGWRIDPYSGARSFHSGSDLAAAAGTPILAVADGVVSFAGERGTYGGLIVVEHTVRGERIASYYAHMYDDGILVAKGDSVAAGQQIGAVGSAGKSTGSHLHVEIRPGGPDSPAVNAVEWLAGQDATGLASSEVTTNGCRPEKAA
jgi:murein DD-endopeptidase MepM/ murein hydrolase activator NlpD